MPLQRGRVELTGELQIASLTSRIDALESRLKRMSALAGCLAIAAGAVGGMALYGVHSARTILHDGVVEARRFVLADADGKPRAVLGVEPSGATSFYLTDARGTPRATLGVGADGVPALGLGDEHGALRAAMAIDGDGASSLGFFDSRRQLRARLGLGADAVPALDIFDDAQHDRVLLSVEPGRSLLRIADRSGQTRVGVGLASGAPGVVVFDETGAPLSRLP